MPLIARHMMDRYLLTVPARWSLRETQRAFIQVGCEVAPVLDENGRVLGIVSSLDLLEAVEQAADEDHDHGEQAEAGPSTLTAGDLAMAAATWVEPDASASEVARRMQLAHGHHVLVGRDGRPDGIISPMHVLRALDDDGRT